MIILCFSSVEFIFHVILSIEILVSRNPETISKFHTNASCQMRQPSLAGFNFWSQPSPSPDGNPPSQAEKNLSAFQPIQI